MKAQVGLFNEEEAFSRNCETSRRLVDSSNISAVPSAGHLMILWVEADDRKKIGKKYF